MESPLKVAINLTRSTIKYLNAQRSDQHGQIMDSARDLAQHFAGLGQVTPKQLQKAYNLIVRGMQKQSFK